MNIEQLIAEYDKKNTEKNKLVNETKELSTKLKQYFTEIASDNLFVDGYVAYLNQEDRSSYDQEKLLEVCRENGLDFLIREFVDINELEQAIVKGEIDASLFKDCIISKYISKLKVVKRNREE